MFRSNKDGFNLKHLLILCITTIALVGLIVELTSSETTSDQTVTEEHASVTIEGSTMVIGEAEAAIPEQEEAVNISEATTTATQGEPAPFFSYSISRLQDIQKERREKKKITTLAKTEGLDLYPDQTTVEIRKGDVISQALQQGGVSASRAAKAIETMSSAYSPRDFKAGQKITLFFETDENGERRMAGFKFAPDVERFIVVIQDHKNPETFKTQVVEKELTREVVAQEAVINSALTIDGQEAGVPYSVLTDLIAIYSWDIDFQRDIHKGDRFEVMYELYRDEDGAFVKTGDILYATLTSRKSPIPVYRFETTSGEVDYFKTDGQSVRRALMRTPINGARLSSGFGMRHHPILGYNKMHKGVDFAAPYGTPILAAGDGVIEYIGRNGGYGNYIRIRHRNDLHTAYAHMKGFASGLYNGKRVKQKQVIGYLGSTGRSTGPHLHYEVHRNRHQVNPRTLKLPKGQTLTASDKTRFQDHIATVKNELSTAMLSGKNLAFKN